MSFYPAAKTEERRCEVRHVYDAPITTSQVHPILPISDAQVINVSSQGIAIATRMPLHPGARLSFFPDPAMPKVTAQVLACEPLEDGRFRLRCRCILGAFDVPAMVGIR